MTGSGTEQDPYIIENVTDLQNIQNNLSAYYELASNIDASATSGWNGGAGFDPVGTFTGHLDGKNYKITDLYIYRPSENRVGVFSRTDTPATITNIYLDGFTIRGNSPVGALCGYNDANLDEVHAENCEVTGRHHVGGLVGDCEHSSLTDSDYKGTVNQVYYAWHGSDVGGLAGFIYNCTVARCFANIIIRAYALSECVGGCFGDLYINNNVDQCFSKGNIYVTFYEPQGYRWRVGGFAGRIAAGTDVDDCYSRVNIAVGNSPTIGSRIGGFCGEHSIGSGYAIDDCYSTGYVDGDSTLGGFNGVGSSYVTNCFWDTETSGQATSAAGTGKTTAQMKTESTFTDAGWNFTTIWDISAEYNNGYPILRMLPTQGSLGGFLWIEGTKVAYTDGLNWKRTIEGTKEGATGETAGHLWVEGTNVRYIDSSGDERYITGTQEGATGQTGGHLWIEGANLRYIDSSGNERYLAGS